MTRGSLGFVSVCTFSFLPLAIFHGQDCFRISLLHWGILLLFCQHQIFLEGGRFRLLILLEALRLCAENVTKTGEGSSA